MPGTPQTLPVPPPVSILTLLNAIRIAAGSGGSGGAAWGSITGTLSAQTDLQTALDARLLLSGGTMTGALTITQATVNAGILTSTGYSLTGSNATSMIDLAGTWNTTGAPTAFKLNITNTASDTTTSRLFDFQVDSSTVFSLQRNNPGAWLFNMPAYCTMQATANNGALTINAGSGGTTTINGSSTLSIYCSSLSMRASGAPLLLGATGYLGFSDSADGGAGTVDTRLYRKAANTLQLGQDAAGVTNQMFTAASRITSDGVGANLTIAGGNGRGGAGGSLILSTYSTAGAATIGTLTTRLTLDTTGLLTFADAVNMAFNKTTGTKIGTSNSQKLAFWGNSPTIRPTAGGASASFTSGGGGGLSDTDTWDGYTLGQIVSAIRLIGLID